MKIYKCDDLSCYYRLNGDTLEYAVMYQDGIFDTDEFAAVELDLVGEEQVTFNGVDTNLYGVFSTVSAILRGDK